MKKKSKNIAMKMLFVTALTVAGVFGQAFGQYSSIRPEADTLNTLFRLPVDIRSGDMITGSVTEYKKNITGDYNASSSRLEGIVLEIEGKQTKLSNRLFSFLVAAGVTSIPFLLKNSAGQIIERGQIPLGSSNLFNPGQQSSSWISQTGQTVFTKGTQFIPEPVCQPGRVLTVAGPFDGNAANTSISLGGQPCEIIAESPRMSYVQVPQNAEAGASNLTIEENNNKEENKVNVAILNLSANKTTLHKGEKATIKVTVNGLQSLKEGNDCKVDITNLSPSVVRFVNAEGNKISQTIPSSLKGNYTFSLKIIAVTQGDYVVEGLLFCTPSPLESDREFEKEVSIEGDDMKLIQLLQDLNRRKDYSYGAHGGMPDATAAWLWKRIVVVMNKLHAMGWDPDPADPNFLVKPGYPKQPVR